MKLKVFLNVAVLMFAAAPAMATIVTGTPVDVVVIAAVLLFMIINSLGSGPN